MAVLLIQLHGIKRGALLPRRVLIGRRSMNHLVIDDPGVSRMHAWIDGEGDRFYLNDAGSRTGTRVNGQRIVARHLLGDEDEITIGPAKLTFLAESRLRPGVDPVDLAAPRKVAPTETGIPFDCPSCKAPLWASASFAGGTGQCKYCGNDLVVPKPKAAKAKPAAPARTTPARPAAPAALRAFPPQASDEMLVSLDRDIPAPAAIAADGAANAPSEPGGLEDQKTAAGKGHAPLFPSPGTRGEGEGLRPSRINHRQEQDTHPGPLPESRERENSAGRATLSLPAPTPPPAAPIPSLRRTREGEKSCGVCQSTISIFEEQTSCPTCGLIFHADCWAENYGCSAYGCPQVNALAPPEKHDHANHSGPHEPGAEADNHNAKAEPHAGGGEFDNPARFPWEFVLLAVSVFSALVGALTFGLPSLALAGGTVTYMARTRGNGIAHRGVVLLSAGLALLGVIAGIPVSWFLYFGGPHS